MIADKHVARRDVDYDKVDGPRKPANGKRRADDDHGFGNKIYYFLK